MKKVNKKIKEEIDRIKSIVEDKKEVKQLLGTKPVITQMPNHIQDYFASVEGNKQQFHSRELFKAEKDDVDVKTDITIDEIINIAKLKWNDEFLESKELKPVFRTYLNNFMRLKISLDRKSRGEFVSVNRGADNIEQASALASNFANINNTKK